VIVLLASGDVPVAIIVLSTNREGEVQRIENSHLKAIPFFF